MCEGRLAGRCDWSVTIILHTMHTPTHHRQSSPSSSLLLLVGPPWPTAYVGPIIAGGIQPEEYDAFMELVLIDEIARCGSGGVLWVSSVVCCVCL